jgi:hypothetical protein
MPESPFQWTWCRHFSPSAFNGKLEWLTIVGIVGDVRQFGLDRPSEMEAYVARAQNVNFS